MLYSRICVEGVVCEAQPLELKCIRENEVGDVAYGRRSVAIKFHRKIQESIASEAV